MKMKANRENNGKSSRKLGRTYQTVTALGIFIVITICGGGCSSRHAITAPYDQTDESSNLSQSEGDDYSDYSTDDESEPEEAGNDNSICHAYNRVGGEVFKVSDMLFATVDSLNKIGK
jgi:hypothetical protein